MAYVAMTWEEGDKTNVFTYVMNPLNYMSSVPPPC